MILPSKYENIKENPLIVGSHILALLKDNPLSFIELHFHLSHSKNIYLGHESLLDTLTFLFLSDIIDFNNTFISLKNDSQ